MKPRNIFYAQSGGVTAVINATALGVIETARKERKTFGKVYAGVNGILGALEEELIDTSKESVKALKSLLYTPGGAFGSCRFKLKDFTSQTSEYERLFQVFSAHDIGYFFYNGGGDSQDTTRKISEYSQKIGYPLCCIGLPKTIDNDLAATDNCPGFGSVAKYVAISTLEAGLDVQSMAKSSTKVFIMEVMGRHAGWIAASAGLASEKSSEPPHIILFPEIPFHPEIFLARVDQCVKDYGYCVVVVSEGIRNADGKFLSETGMRDSFGHEQLGGVATTLARLIKDKLGLKYHYAIADFLQRAARHIASKTDVDQAYALGKTAVTLAKKGVSDVMLTLKRRSQKPYRWSIEHVSLKKVANVEKTVPRSFIQKDGFGITPKCREYLLPLIQGEAYPPYKQGIPAYQRLQNIRVKKKLLLRGVV